MSQEPKYTKSSEETVNIGEYIYQLLTTSTTDPQHAAEVITVVMVRLWLAGRSPNGSLDKMLEGFCNTIRLNVDNAESTLQ